MSGGADALTRVEITRPQDLWDWLSAHHGQAASVWLVTYKAADPARYVSRDQVLDALIAYGWIDGTRRKLDAVRTMQLIAPRQQQAWARSYRDRAARLAAEGRMQPPGRAAIEAARKAGTWDALDHVDALVVPEDLATALAAHGVPEWEGLAPSYRRNVLRWIANAKKPQTRARRIAAVAEAAARGAKVPQF